MKEINKVHGLFKLVVLNKAGNVVRELPWQDNLVTDLGLNVLATAGTLASGTMGAYLYVGTGNSTPDGSQTNLDNPFTPIALRANEHRTTFNAGNSTSPDIQDYISVLERFTFNRGDIVGNVAELGISSSINSSTAAFRTRALVKDENGDPTVLTVTAEDQLIVFYEIRLYKDIKVPYSFSAPNGGDPVTGELVYARHTGPATNITMNFSFLYLGNSNGFKDPLSDNDLASNTIGAVFDNWVSATTTGISAASSVSGNVRTLSIEVPPSAGNATFNSMILTPSGHAAHLYLHLDEAITKTDQDILELEIKRTFERYEP